MALTKIGYELAVTLIDKGADKSNVRYALVAADESAAITAGQAILTDLAAVTDAGVQGYRIGVVYEDSAASLAGEVKTKAVVSVKLAGTPEKWATVKIPAPKDTLFAGATGKLYNVIDPADSVLVAYLANFESGGNATISDGENIADSGTPAYITGRRV